MKADIRDRWVAALRSGKYVQGHGALKIAHPESETAKHCCLGVLCEIAVEDGIIPESVRRMGRTVEGKVFEEFDNRSDILPASVREWAELEDGNPYLVMTEVDEEGQNEFDMPASEWNDEHGKTFEDIAQAIEQTFSESV